MITPMVGLLPAEATVGRWYRTSDIIGRWGKQWGTIRARLAESGDVELTLVTADNLTSLPWSTFLPASPAEHWTYSEAIEVGR